MKNIAQIFVRLSAFAFAIAFLATTTANAQGIPDKYIPPSVQAELRLVQARFVSALTSDCASDKCFAGTCSYVNHLTLDQPRSTSLPGLPADEGLGSVTPQEYLTEVTCQYSHERKVGGRAVKALNRRLEKRLSSGWLKVTVKADKLDAIPKSLSEEAPIKEDKPPAPEPVPEPEPEPVEPWTADKVPEELWHTLLPHFWWMILIFLFTMAIFMLIWAGRRLGAPSMEEKMLEAQMNAPQLEAPEEDESLALVEEERPSVSDIEEQSFVEQQEEEWEARISEMEIGEPDNVIMQLLREWLRKGDYETLARALFVFGDKVNHAFAKDTEHAMKKVEFAEYFRDVDEKKLPSRGHFFRKLNQQAMSSQLLSQDDVQLYRSLREDFGSNGVLSLMRIMPPRYGALLFALVPREGQYDVAKMMSEKRRVQVAEQLLSSTRISQTEAAYIFSCVAASRDQGTLPPPPKDATMLDRGPSIDGAQAISILMSHISSEHRGALFSKAFAKNGGGAPRWYEDILFNHMLTALPEEHRNDLLLDVDVRALSAWLSMQDAPWQKVFKSELSDSLQSALYQSGGFANRTEQLRMAQLGHAELVAALKSSYARDRARFADLVAA